MTSETTEATETIEAPAVVTMLDALSASTTHGPTLETIAAIRTEALALHEQVEKLRAGFEMLTNLAEDGMPRSAAIRAAQGRLGDLTDCSPFDSDDELAVLEHAVQWVEVVSGYKPESGGRCGRQC